jgi:hypothetical protein
MKDTTEILNVGNHIMQIEFLAHEISSYGFWSPASVKGTAKIKLFYLSTVKELRNKINSEFKIDKKILEQFFKDEGLITRKAQTYSTIGKFVERKVIQF